MLQKEIIELNGTKLVDFHSDENKYVIDRTTGRKYVRFVIFEKDLEKSDVIESCEKVPERILPEEQDELPSTC